MYLSERCLWTQEWPRRIIAHHHTSQTPRLLPQGKRPWCVSPWSHRALEPMGLGRFISLPARSLGVSVSLLNTLLMTYMDCIECLSTCLDLRVRKRSLGVALDQVWQNKQDNKPRQAFRPSNFYCHKSSCSPHPRTAASGGVPSSQSASHLQKIRLSSGWAGGMSFPAGRPAFFFY